MNPWNNFAAENNQKAKSRYARDVKDKKDFFRLVSKAVLELFRGLKVSLSWYQFARVCDRYNYPAA